MAISVIVPVYNTGAFLEKCVRSIEAQTFTDYELILIDDGSTDGSGTMCDKLAERDARIRVVHQKNAGLSAVRNRGVSLASGEYILFIDSDDFIEPEMLSQMMGAARLQGADIVMCRYNMMDVQHNVLSVGGIDNRCVISTLDAMDMVIKDKEIRSYTWNKLIRRSIFHGITFPVGRNFEDMATVYKLIDRANCVVNIPYAGYNYVRQPKSITKTPRYTARWMAHQIDVMVAWRDRFFYVRADERLAHLAPFCAGKSYYKGLHLLDTCYRRRIHVPQDKLQEILLCMKTVKESGELQRLPLKMRCGLWIVRARKAAWQIARALKPHHLAKASMSIAMATVGTKK